MTVEQLARQRVFANITGGKCSYFRIIQKGETARDAGEMTTVFMVFSKITIYRDSIMRILVQMGCGVILSLFVRLADAASAMPVSPEVTP